MDINVVLGRFNPFSKGHYKIITEIDNGLLTYIFVIDGENTSKNIQKNPLSLNERLTYIKNLNIPNTKLMYASSAYEILDICDVLNLNINNIICGEDRSKSYKSLFKTNILCFDRTDNISSTKIKEIIKKDNYEEYSQLMAPSSYNKQLYNLLYKRLLNGNTTNTNNELQ